MAVRNILTGFALVVAAIIIGHFAMQGMKIETPENFTDRTTGAVFSSFFMLFAGLGMICTNLLDKQPK